MTIKPELKRIIKIVSHGIMATFSLAEENGFKKPFVMDITDKLGQTMSCSMSKTGEIDALEPTEDPYMMFPLTLILTDRQGWKLGRKICNPEWIN